MAFLVKMFYIKIFTPKSVLKVTTCVSQVVVFEIEFEEKNWIRLDNMNYVIKKKKMSFVHVTNIFLF